METKRCDNCEKDVPEQNYDLHLVFCLRNVWKCHKCGELVPINSKDHHIDTFHASYVCLECGMKMESGKKEVHIAEECEMRPLSCQYCGERFPASLLRLHEEQNCESRLVPCQFCKKTFDRNILEFHKNECPSKPKSCPFCEMTIPNNEFHDHQAYCGARTERCEKCGRFIKLSDQEIHLVTDCRYPPEDNNNPNSSSAGGGGSDYFPDAVSPDGGGMQCPFCAFQTAEFEELQIHMLTKHEKEQHDDDDDVVDDEGFDIEEIDQVGVDIEDELSE